MVQMVLIYSNIFVKLEAEGHLKLNLSLRLSYLLLRDL